MYIYNGTGALICRPNIIISLELPMHLQQRKPLPHPAPKQMSSSSQLPDQISKTSLQPASNCQLFKQSLSTQNTRSSTCLAPEPRPQPQGLQFEENSNQPINFAQLALIRERKLASHHKTVEAPCHEPEESQTIPIACEKVKLPTDEDETVKAGLVISKKFKEQVKEKQKLLRTQKKEQRSLLKLNKQIESPLAGPLKKEEEFSIPHNEKAEAVIQSSPLRLRYGYLLDKEDRYLIGYDHRVLLSTLRQIYSVISFSREKKVVKSCFFLDLKKKVKGNGSCVLTQRSIQQILFLDDQLLKVQWQKYAKNREQGYDFDLLITIPNYEFLDPVIKEARKKIVWYLMAKELQFRRNNGVEQGCVDRWVDGFDPNTIQIQTKALPMRPDIASASLTNMTHQEIRKITNEPMREVCLRKKAELESQSRVSNDVVDMIFHQDSNTSVKDKLYKAIREKQQKIEEKQRVLGSSVAIDNSTLLNIIDQILMTYMAKRVSNIAKGSLIDILDKKLRIKHEIVVEAVRLILQAVEIKFLVEHTSSAKIVILQMDRTKYQPMRTYATNLQLE